MTYEFWNAADSNRLRKLSADHTPLQLAELFHRSEQSIIAKLKRMGVDVPGKTTQPERRPRAATPGKCTSECTGGNRCCLTNEFMHTLHICTDEDCICHSAGRYQEARKR